MEKNKNLGLKALKIFKKFKTDYALQWLLDNNLTIVDELVENICKGEREGKQIESGKSFSFNQNKYELLCMEDKSVYREDCGTMMGDFLLYFNNNLVAKTSYFVELYERPEYFKKIFWSDDPIFILLKLSDWVEEIPKIVEVEKKKEFIKESADKKNNEMKELKEINKNFDLGKYK